MTPEVKAEAKPEIVEEITQERIDLEEEPEKTPSQWLWPSLAVFSLVAALIVTILIMAALRISRQDKTLLKVTPTPTVAPEPTTGTDSSMTKLEEQSFSDEISAIEADLKATDLSGLDQELDEIEKELATP